ncbi:MAG TPA: hypothetical protein VGF92_15835 [Stellaceae bacterium]|jgi:hypothetical protein
MTGTAGILGAAPTLFNWDPYSQSVFNLLSTELNSLANSSTTTLSTLGAAFDNSVSGAGASFGDIYADVEFIAGAGYSPTAGGFIELWLLRTLNAGTNYEDGSSSIPPARPADIIIPVRNGTTITPRAGMPGLILPPGAYKPLARNQSGATLPSTGNIIRIRPYSEQY